MEVNQTQLNTKVITNEQIKYLGPEFTNQMLGKNTNEYNFPEDVQNNQELVYSSEKVIDNTQQVQQVEQIQQMHQIQQMQQMQQMHQVQQIQQMQQMHQVQQIQQMQQMHQIHQVNKFQNLQQNQNIQPINRIYNQQIINSHPVSYMGHSNFQTNYNNKTINDNSTLQLIPINILPPGKRYYNFPPQEAIKPNQIVFKAFQPKYYNQLVPIKDIDEQIKYKIVVSNELTPLWILVCKDKFIKWCIDNNYIL